MILAWGFRRFELGFRQTFDLFRQTAPGFRQLLDFSAEPPLDSAKPLLITFFNAFLS
jgi:hypothetical protein